MEKTIPSNFTLVTPTPSKVIILLYGAWNDEK